MTHPTTTQVHNFLETYLSKQIDIDNIKTFLKTYSDGTPKEQELLEPILTKARNAIEDVAKEERFTYIFDSSMGSILYVDESENVLSLVRKKLGL